MPKYRKKPVVIDAFRFDYDSLNPNGTSDMPGWAKSAYDQGVLFLDCDPPTNPIELFIKTLEGRMRVSDGDYIIRGVNGEIYPCKPDIFAKTYELESEDAHA